MLEPVEDEEEPDASVLEAREVIVDPLLQRERQAPEGGHERLCAGVQEVGDVLFCVDAERVPAKLLDLPAPVRILLEGPVLEAQSWRPHGADGARVVGVRMWQSDVSHF